MLGETLEKIPFLGPDTSQQHHALTLPSHGKTDSCLCSKWTSQGSLCLAQKRDDIIAPSEDKIQYFKIPLFRNDACLLLHVSVKSLGLPNGVHKTINLECRKKILEYLLINIIEVVLSF